MTEANTAFLTPTAILAFPVLDAPKADRRGQLKYSCVLLIPKTSDITAIKNAIAAAKAAGFPDPKTHAGLKSGVKDGDKPNGNGNIPNGYPGHWAINCVTKYAPALVDEKVQKVLNVKDKFYPGCKVIAQINAFTFNTDGNRGVSFGVSAIQWVGHGTKLASSVDPAKVFAAVPGSAAATATGDSPDDFGTAPTDDGF
jgi:hypothetical protein